MVNNIERNFYKAITKGSKPFSEEENENEEGYLNNLSGNILSIGQTLKLKDSSSDIITDDFDFTPFLDKTIEVLEKSAKRCPSRPKKRPHIRRRKSLPRSMILHEGLMSCVSTNCLEMP